MIKIYYKIHNYPFMQLVTYFAHRSIYFHVSKSINFKKSFKYKQLLFLIRFSF